ncbi:MAG: ABC transporter ATP-binding protein [Alsobacter sp.]
MGDEVLQIAGLVKSYGARRVLDGVDMTVARGQVIGFLGPNGAGKTTVMSIATGLLTPDAGEVRLFGVTGGARRPQLRMRIGYLQEKPRLYPEMSARDYLTLFARLHGVARPATRVERLLERFGLADSACRPLASFSRGMQQRACLARVLLHEPEFLILDEPTLGLDPSGLADMRATFRDLRDRGMTLLFSSHQLAEMERICDGVVLLSGGRVLAQGRPADLLPTADGGEGLRVELVEAVGSVLGAIRDIEGVVAAREAGAHLAEVLWRPAQSCGDRDRRASLAKALTAAGLTVLSVGSAPPTLEDLFLTLTRDRPAPQPQQGESPWTSAIRTSAVS